MGKIEDKKFGGSKQIRPFLFALLVSGLLMLSFAALVTAAPSAPVTLSVSKSVDQSTALAGRTLEYTIVVSASDSGDSVSEFVLTDTLPVDTSYVTDSLSTEGESSDVTISGGVLTATDTFFTGDAVTITFQVTTSESAVTGTMFTNTVYMEDIGNTLILSDSAVTTIITYTGSLIYLPIIGISLDGPTLDSIAAPSGTTNEWTVSWSDEHSSLTGATGYELQEATDANFTENVVTTELGLTTSTTINKALGNQATYHYRVRVVRDTGINNKSLWSNVESVQSIYYYEETFDDSSNPTDWRIVRQDTDSVINIVSISDEDPDYLDLRMESGYDYMIASDLTELPDGAYTLSARMRIQDADPRHTAGIIIGADYDGSSDCPVSIDGQDYSSCFTEYYRFQFIAGNEADQISTQIKRIDEHSESNNSGSGPELATGLREGGDRSDWVEWSIEVSADGTMVLKADGTTISTVQDTTYQDNRYFGFWSSTSDTSFSNTQIDWVKIESN